MPEMRIDASRDCAEQLNVSVQAILQSEWAVRNAVEATGRSTIFPTLADNAALPEIAIALSGGGSRSMAFHLGCLRALHNAGLLEKITTMSSVSGGSVLAALYCHYTGDFECFEKEVRRLLAQGFVRPALRIAFTTREGISAFACITTLVCERTAAFLAKSLLHLFAPHLVPRVSWLKQPAFRRWSSRTKILQRVFSEIFAGDTLRHFREDRPKLIIVACELQDKSAFYFASEGVGSWRLGMADPSKVEIAKAVTASAAYPALLPALDESMVFVKNGESKTQRVILTDGGVYDNLGLAPLWPDRVSAISLHVNTSKRIIACRAGYGLARGVPTVFWPPRMIEVLYSALARMENLSINRLFDLLKAGKIEGVLLPYLGQDDQKLNRPPLDLVSASTVADYPTDFSAMPEHSIDLLTRRGEQLTKALLDEHWAEWMANSD